MSVMMSAAIERGGEAGCYRLSSEWNACPYGDEWDGDTWGYASNAIQDVGYIAVDIGSLPAYVSGYSTLDYGHACGRAWAILVRDVGGDWEPVEAYWMSEP